MKISNEQKASGSDEKYADNKEQQQKQKPQEQQVSKQASDAKEKDKS